MVVSATVIDVSGVLLSARPGKVEAADLIRKKRGYGP